LSLSWHLIGGPGRDNALYVRVDSGQATERLLFDCGEGCVAELPPGEARAIDELCLSHLHMDHVAGFDSYFRAVYDRTTKPNRIWGPPGAAAILQHRFQGFLWNLHAGAEGSWRVHEADGDRVRVTRYDLGEAFATAHFEGEEPAGDQDPSFRLRLGAGYELRAVLLDHHTPVLGYVLRELTRRNVDPQRLAALGLAPGPWLQRVKEQPAEEPAAPDARGEEIRIGAAAYALAELRRLLLVEVPGSSIAYLTDFRLDDRARRLLPAALRGCRTLVCEAQYHPADRALAERHAHLTSVQAAELARSAAVEELVLMHLSDRYDQARWREMLVAAREIFPNTRFAPSWKALG